MENFIFLCNVEKRKRKSKNEKNPNNNNKYYFTFPFLYGKFYILLGNILGKTQVILLHLYYSFFPWQIIGNAVMKH